MNVNLNSGEFRYSLIIVKIQVYDNFLSKHELDEIKIHELFPINLISIGTLVDTKLEME